MPNYTKTLLEFSNIYSNFSVARFVNTETNQTIQMSQYNMKQLITTKKCFCRLCNDINQKASQIEYQIASWDKPVWLLTWYKNNDNYYNRKNSIDVPRICPKCGSIIALVDNGKKVGCSRYPECNYVLTK